MGILAETPCRLIDPHPLEERPRTRPRLCPLRVTVAFEHFDELFADRAMRSEERHRVLEDEAHPFAANGVERAFVKGQEILTRRARDARDPRRRCRQAKRCQQRLALARARLTDKADALAGQDGQRDARHRNDGALARRELDREIAQFKYRCEGRGHHAIHRRGR